MDYGRRLYQRHFSSHKNGKNFLGLENVSFEKAKFLILPIPYELTTSFVKGTYFAPECIISVSNQLEFFDEKFKVETYNGIRTLLPLSLDIKSPSYTMKKIENNIKKNYKNGKILISIGGEHTITYGIIKGFKHFYKNFNIIVLDAHSDLRDKYQNNKFSHACVSRRVFEEGLNLYILGVRSMSKDDFLFTKDKRNLEIFYSYQMKKFDWKKEIVEKLPSGKYYLSIDADFFDPSLIPEVGTPEPGGFQWDETIEFFENLILRKDIEIIGFDFVEMCPRNLNSPSSFISAKIIYKLITLLSLNENRTSK